VVAVVISQLANVPSRREEIAALTTGTTVAQSSLSLVVSTPGCCSAHTSAARSPRVYSWTMSPTRAAPASVADTSWSVPPAWHPSVGALPASEPSRP